MVSEDRGTSVVMTLSLRRAAEAYDVAILGGGLAGLTLAIQLKRERPETSVVVLEKREGPAPLAAFKVGESTLLSGAHYFAHMVGLLDHLEQKQLLKNGLRFLCPTEDNRDVTERAEFGPISFPDRDTYQLDRGLLENELALRARGVGVDLVQGARVQEVSLGDDMHTVEFTHAEETMSTRARWVVDAAGRASLLKRKLGLARDVEHTINAAWLRLGGGLDFEQWGAGNPDWMARMTEPGIRMYSTNHLLGEGYWVWLIPLASGPISIGVCADPRLHPLEEIGDLDHWLHWMSRHEPQLADAIRAADQPGRGLSPRRGLRLRGRARIFHGSLVPGRRSRCVRRSVLLAGVRHHRLWQLIRLRSDRPRALAERTSRTGSSTTTTSTIAPCQFVLSRTEHNYPVFGNPWVMAGKLGWDVYHIHTGVTVLMVKDKLTDLEFMRSVDEDINRLYQLSINMQKVFRQWHEIEKRPRTNAMLLPIRARVPGFPAFLQEMSDDELRESLRDQVRYAEAIAVAIFGRAAGAMHSPPASDLALDPYTLDLGSSDFAAGASAARSITHRRCPRDAAGAGRPVGEDRSTSGHASARCRSQPRLAPPEPRIGGR